MKTHNLWIPEGEAGVLLARYARSSIKHAAKVRIIQLIAKALPDMVFRLSGTSARLVVDPRDYIGWALLTLGTFEPLSLNLAIDLMSGESAGVFLDIGAHHGLYTTAVGSSANCGVVAIEASLANFQVLVKNVSLNEKNNVRLVNCAAASREALFQLCLQGEGRSAWTKIQTGPSVPQQPYLAGLRLDLILSCLNIEKIRLLKIDVEGYELEVFQGLNWDGPCRPHYVLMECNPGELEKMKYLVDRGYEIQTVDGSAMESVSEFPEGNLLFTDVLRKN